MIINNKEYAGTLSCDGSMHIELELENTEGLTVGEDVEIKNGYIPEIDGYETTYFGRVIESIEGGHVVCDAPAGETEYDAALEKLGVTL